MNLTVNRKSSFLRPASVLILVAAGAFVFGQGCVIDSTDSGTNTCAENAAISCMVAGQVGYSCSGLDSPGEHNSNLTCGAGQDDNGDTDYCCATGTTNTGCVVDSTLGCSNGDTGYDCSNGVAPDATLNCGGGQAESDGTVGYCCNGSTTGDCIADASIDCSAGGSGVNCTNGALPSSVDPTLSCGSGVTDANGSEDYCCTGTTTDDCIADPTVTGCTGGSDGYSCTGNATPDQTNSSLDCSAGTSDNGDTLYCCVTLSSGTTCGEDPTVTGCGGNSIGFSCTGTDTPEDADPSLSCSTGTPANGDTLYCCTD